ncbi:MAG: ATP-binding protein [Chloroherpetonaceae bacterium]|nr:ATP-binding protein [Chloroherpetonaceae bacterium]MCS7210625.1 ATP-binding protein [Chloroherpetonaceae bacterium]MDW8019923.1 ATP-binding protein [Chloroherpetonaceae bacterium]MDW8466592.1 ATP-binding protein [Chloroherpetonaceae bacterium]
MTKNTATENAPEAVKIGHYGELVLYAIAFLLLVTSIFVINYVLAQRSEEDAKQVALATQSAREWQRAEKSLRDMHLRFFMLTQYDTAFKEFATSIRQFDELQRALREGGPATLFGTAVAVKPIEEEKAVQAWGNIDHLWQPHREKFLKLAAASADRIDTLLLEQCVETMVKESDAILNANQRFITTLGEVSNERIARLQTLQVSALLLSLGVFFAMAVRLTISLRKRDRIIQQSTDEILRQRNQLASEKERVEKLLSDLKSTQAQLIQSEKMASLGQMVAGIAHEVNTPLGFVTNNLSVIERNVGILERALREYQKMEKMLREGELAELEAQLENIRSMVLRIEELSLVERTRRTISESNIGLQRIQELVTNLRNFSRLDEATCKLVNLAESIDSALMIATNMVKHKAEVIKNYAPNLMVECYPAQLNQVFLNLITNATQAIEKFGKITITTLTEGDKAIIKIADTGIGIPEENLKKIFEPFFTTKPVGQGTGLGLSIVYKIIEQHHGTIQVASEVGRGTEFTITLPLRQTRRSNVVAEQKENIAS